MKNSRDRGPWLRIEKKKLSQDQTAFRDIKD
jgi:hypothetical protein